MAVTDEELVLLAELIKTKIAEEFSKKHMSGNLAKTVEITRTGNGQVAVSIPARSYNMAEYQLTGVIKSNGHGSYASKLDTIGSEFYTYNQNRKRVKRVTPHNHVGFVDDVINEAIEEWLTRLGGKYKIKGKAE